MAGGELGSGGMEEQERAGGGKVVGSILMEGMVVFLYPYAKL